MRNGQIPTIVHQPEEQSTEEKKKEEKKEVGGEELPDLTYIELPIAAPNSHNADCQSISSRRDFVFHIPLPTQVYTFINATAILKGFLLLRLLLL